VGYCVVELGKIAFEGGGRPLVHSVSRVFAVEGVEIGVLVGKIVLVVVVVG
jgi:hypothetical protein